MATGLAKMGNELQKTSDQELIEVMSLVCQVLNRCAEKDQLWLPDAFLPIIKKNLPAR